MTVDQFRSVYTELPTPGAKLFALFLVSTGARLGEATAVLVEDIDIPDRTLSITKSLQDVGREFHPNGHDRFRVAPMTKTGQDRVIGLNDSLVRQLTEWVRGHGLAPDQLLFPRSLVLPPRRAKKQRSPLTEQLVGELGVFAGPNRRSYSHGTVNGYITGKCRCEFCRQAASQYSLERRRIRNRQRSGAVKQAPITRVRYRETDYLPRDRWSSLWKRACLDAGLPFMPTAYQVRHTHASWLIDQGEDPKTVMTRLGHRDLSTTSLYVHDVGDDRSSADIMESLLDLD